MVMGPDDAGRNRERSALVILDRGTRWLQCFPLPDKSSEAAIKAFTSFLGPRETVQLFYSDNSQELINAAAAMGWPHDRSTPGQPQTNGVAERAVRAVLEGTRTILHHAGFMEKYWPLACQYWCVAHNISACTTDPLKRSPWTIRHKGKKFEGKRLPFGCLIDFLPSPIADPQLKFAPRAQPGLFIGWRLHPGGTWRNEYLVVPLARMMDDIGERLIPRQCESW
jgi:hypothetical protein